MGTSRLHHFTKAHVMHYTCNFIIFFVILLLL